jgi:hypothetical protein
MSDAGHASGERAAAARRAELNQRSRAERFADESLAPLVWCVLLAGSVLGAVFTSDHVRQLTVGYLPEVAEFDEPALWTLCHLEGLVVGVLAAFLCLDVPIFVLAGVLRRVRPDLFERKSP